MNLTLHGEGTQSQLRLVSDNNNKGQLQPTETPNVFISSRLMADITFLAREVCALLHCIRAVKGSPFKRHHMSHGFHITENPIVPHDCHVMFVSARPFVRNLLFMFRMRYYSQWGGNTQHCLKLRNA